MTDRNLFLRHEQKAVSGLFIFYLALMLVVSSFLIFTQPKETTVSAQVVPQYQDVSAGLPTESLWVSKVMFFDIDQDGTKDVFSLGPRKGDGENSLSVWKWTGAAWRQVNTEEGLSTIGHSSYGGYSFADFDNDGDWDIGAGSHGADEVDAFMNVAPSTYLETSLGLDTARDAWNIDFGDYNSDGNMDLLETGFWGMDSRAFAGSGLGTWLEQSTGLPEGHTSVEGHFCDVNNDGNLDIIATWGFYGWVYTGDGNGYWTNSSQGLPEGAWLGDSINWGDFNNDGNVDIVISYEGSTRAFAGDGTGHWTMDSAGLPDIQYEGVVLADMNNDKYDDLVAVTGSDPGYVHIYLYTGTNLWVKADTTIMQGNAKSWRLHVEDFDCNGHRDIVAGFGTDNDMTFPGSINVWRETTTPTDLDIQLAYPDGGEYFKSGSAWLVRWLSTIPAGSETRTVKLELSTSGAAGPWTLIEDNLPDTGVYQWTVPDEQGGNCYIRATISDSLGGEASDENDNAFGIDQVPGSNTPPEIEVTEPDGNDDEADEQYTITWTADDDDGDTLEIELYYDTDTDPGSGLTVIEAGLANTGSYDWDCSGVEEGDYYVHGVADDGNGGRRADYSPGTVSVTHTGPVNHDPVIRVTEPDGEDDEADTSYTITWEASDEDGDILEIELYFDNDTDPGNGRRAIETGLANTGSYDWDCSEVDDGGYYIYARVDDGNGSSADDYSPGKVLVSHRVNHDPVVELSSVDVVDDETLRLWWNATDEDDDPLEVTLYHDTDTDPGDGLVLIKDGQEASGSYDWDISDMNEGEYHILAAVEDGQGEKEEVTARSSLSVFLSPFPILRSCPSSFGQETSVQANGCSSRPG